MQIVVSLNFNILESMDLNSHMSISESYDIVAYESEALGVLCIKALDVDYLKVIKDKIEQSRK